MPMAATASAPAGEGTIEMREQGVQASRCEPSANGLAWRVKGPEAIFYDGAGRTWRANDGGSVVGGAVASRAAPGANAVPWLVLRAGAPAGGCDAGPGGLESRVPDSATCGLFRQAGSAP